MIFIPKKVLNFNFNFSAEKKLQTQTPQPSTPHIPDFAQKMTPGQVLSYMMKRNHGLVSKCNF